MRKVAAVVFAGLISAAGLTVPTVEAQAGDSCEPGWVQSGTGLWDNWSPKFTTNADPAGGGRSISFHVKSGRIGYYVYSNCSVGREGTVFPTASEYRVYGKYSSGDYTITSGGSRGWNWPGKCAGYDEIAGFWRTWDC